MDAGAGGAATDRSSIFIVQSPPCSWLGSGRKALVVNGPTNRHEFDLDGTTLHGLWSPLTVGPACDACEFTLAGDLLSGCTLFRKSDRRQWLENDHGRKEVGTPIHCWGCIERPEWARRYALAADGTMSPVPNPNQLCLGVKREGAEAKVFGRSPSPSPDPDPHAHASPDLCR